MTLRRHMLPPGWFVHPSTRKSVPPCTSLRRSLEKGHYLVATCDMAIGDVIMRDPSVLTVLGSYDELLKSPLSTYLQTLVRQYGQDVLSQGHAFVLCTFLLQAKAYPRATQHIQWDILTEWWCPEEALKGARDIAGVLHDLLPTAWADVLSLHEVNRLLAVFDMNSLLSQIADAPPRTCLFPYGRLLEHACNPNAQICFVVEGTRTVLQVNALQPIAKGESVSISYIPSYKPTDVRRELLFHRYFFVCHCKQCTELPDLCRAFRCWFCPKGKEQGVISPCGDGTRHEMWSCQQCGLHPTEEKVQEMLGAEEAMSRVKADKTIGMFKLIDNEFLHFTHHHIFQKLDSWAEISWKEQDARLCENYIETLLKCVQRMLPAVDVTKAQYHEFMGQIHHALGNAHTAKSEYTAALEIREKAGQGNTAWAHKTRKMAQDKSLADFMDKMKVRMPYTKASYQATGIVIANKEQEVCGSIENVEVVLLDIRDMAQAPRLSEEGLVVLYHPTSVTGHWLDDSMSNENKMTYAVETVQMLREVTGATRVAVFDMDMRMSPCTARDALSAATEVTFLKPESGPLGVMVVGTRVRDVTVGGAAEVAGLRPGMTILRVNGEEVDNYKGALAEALGKISPGGEVRASVTFGFLGASGKGLRDPAGAIHLDQSPLFEADPSPAKSPPCCLRHTQRPLNEHFMIVNVWRSMDAVNPVQRDVLAFCDISTVSPHDMVHAEAGGAAFVRLAPNPAHTWRYVSNITADEVIIHRQYDTRVEDPTRRAIFHTACRLRNQEEHPEWAPRQSVEVRCLLYFEGCEDKTEERVARKMGADLTKTKTDRELIQSLETNGDDAVTWYLLGQQVSGAATVHGKAMTKQQCFVRALQLDSTRPEAWCALGGATRFGETVSVRDGALLLTKTECYLNALDADISHDHAWFGLASSGGKGIRNFPPGSWGQDQTAATDTVRVGGRVYSPQGCLVMAVELNERLTDAWLHLAALLPEGGTVSVLGVVVSKKECLAKGFSFLFAREPADVTLRPAVTASSKMKRSPEKEAALPVRHGRPW